jgi:hypothetical protein
MLIYLQDRRLQNTVSLSATLGLYHSPTTPGQGRELQEKVGILTFLSAYDLARRRVRVASAAPATRPRNSVN